MKDNDNGAGNIDYLQDIALVIAVTCVRNTIIEQYHAEGKLTNKEMKAFNIEVADNLYSFLYFNTGHITNKEDRKHFLELMFKYYPTNWDRPKLKQSIFDALDVKKGNLRGKKLMEEWGKKDRLNHSGMAKLEKEFLNALKTIPASPDILHDPLYAPVLLVIQLLETNQRKVALNILFRLIETGTDIYENKLREDAPDFFLTLSEIPEIPKHIKSFLIDAMLLTEGDKEGEFHNLKELRVAFKKLRTQ